MQIHTPRGLIEIEQATTGELMSALRLSHHFTKQEHRLAETLSQRVFELEMEIERMHVLLDMAEA